MTNNSVLPITGGCFCKKVQYKINKPIGKMGVCHCHSCQKLTGGAAWPFMVVDKADIELSGDYTRFTREALSGKQAHFHFCPECGTSVFGTPDLWPDYVVVSASTLDEQHHFKPAFHVWTEDAQCWVNFDDKTPAFLKTPE